METVPAAAGPQFMGVLTVGFVFLAIYVFAKISSEGRGRFNACKKAVVFGTIGMSLAVVIEALDTRRRILPPIEDPSISTSILLVPLILSIPFFFVILIDLLIQWVMLRND